MPEIADMNPAELAAKESLEALYQAIDQKKNFLLEAGAGAGKTYSLIKALRYIIAKNSRYLLRKDQRVACITFTNVAKNEIRTRTDSHPAILSETIHSFCWSLIVDFQPSMRTIIPKLDKWKQRIEEAGGVGTRKVIYDLGYPKVEEEGIFLHHDDVIDLTVRLMKEQKFRTILASRYPVIFIDEYQDTNKSFANSLKTHFIDPETGPLIGFFGDHWQKIYGQEACGKIEWDKLTEIKKEANFRSDKLIVECLNMMRPELPQKIKDEQSQGMIDILHTNMWVGTRRNEAQWDGDLPVENARAYRIRAKEYLMGRGWDFNPQETKILMLTHNLLADEQGYKNLANVFSHNDSFIKKEDDYIEYFVDYLEPICNAYQSRKYGEMFKVLGQRTPNIRTLKDKVKWKNDFDKLIKIRNSGSIGDVIDHLKETQRPRLSDKIESKERKIVDIETVAENERSEDDKRFMERLQNLKRVSYKEVTTLTKFVEDQTLFATNHGVKGAEFENVFIVIGRGWSLYNFNQMLEWEQTGIPAGEEKNYERNRNLFYVACSRPKSKLAILFTQEISKSAMQTLKKWFGENSIHAL
ncbi:MAG: UvrD-helicase domain-containing protein [Ignavibacteria bacterium]|nr:UvrD-helicase domain-containing protein [Ignavibacteria bacterium]